MDHLEEGVDVEAEPERDRERETVRDDVHEPDDRLEVDVAANAALPLQRRERLVTAL